jgi:hypothetical protein
MKKSKNEKKISACNFADAMHCSFFLGKLCFSSFSLTAREKERERGEDDVGEQWR